MVEVSERWIKEEEIELDLGLSIGGTSFRRAEEPKLRLGETTEVLRSNCSAVSTATLSEAESLVVDPQVKREIQALRRQEAKRKREEKKTRAHTGEPLAKKNGVHVNLNMSNGSQAEGHNCPVGPVQYPYAPVQFASYSNGFAYPCVVPCWGAPNGGFRQFQANQDVMNNGEQNGKTTSLINGSPIRSSSTISENYSAATHEGGSSDFTRSHSSCLDGSVGEKNKAQSDHTSTSHPAESNHNLVQPKEELAPGNTEPVTTAKPISPKVECPPAPLMKEVKMKPPKPKTTCKTPSMPYVSATGKGPNGKTVHGFLHNYSKSEISIVCVCHGSTFSPAEFVQHAGGTEVSQPLRHIRVIPSAFG